MEYYRDLKHSLETWYWNSKGVRNLRTLILENNYTDPTHDPRTKYQIDRYELWRNTCYILSLPLAGLAALNGYKLANKQFEQVNELMIYDNRMHMYRLRQSYRSLAVLGYGLPVLIRTATFVTFLLGVPALAGVYHDDTDYISHYVISGGVGGAVVATFTTSTEFRGIRQKLVAAGLGMLPGLMAGIMCTFSQKYNVYPSYDLYKKRWKEIDPIWTDYVEKVGLEEAEKEEKSFAGEIESDKGVQVAAVE